MGWPFRSAVARGLAVLWAITVLALGCAPDTRPPATATVQRVIDGDTVELNDGRRVRYLGIDTPETAKKGRPAEFLAEAAKDANARLVLQQPVRLEYDEERYDHYGRTLAYVFREDGRMVNAELVRAGLARVYLIPPNVKYRQLLVASQRQAMAARVGLWEQPLTADERVYPGNSRTWRFHRPACPSVKGIAAHNRVQFAHPHEAYSQGYSPCRNCRP